MTLTQDLHKQGLCILGTCAPEPSDNLPEGSAQIALVGPDEPRFWDVFTAAPEYSDGRPDPMDRWSKRVVDAISKSHQASAFYPSDGPPWHPFQAWALRSGVCFISPVALLVHARRGLFVSFRAALALQDPLSVAPDENPCTSCSAQPCRAACPVGALKETSYDVAACTSHIKATPDADCLAGCRARRACPIGRERRSPEQSRFHMDAFLPPSS